MSRPTASVPSRNSVGAARHPDRRREEVRRGTARPADAARCSRRTRAPRTTATMTTRPATAPLVLAEIVPELAQRPGRRFRGGRLGEEIERLPWSGPWLTSRSRMRGIDQAVEQIDDQVDDHHDGRDQQHAALHRPGSRAGRSNRPATCRSRARRRSSRSGSRRRTAAPTCRPIMVTTGISALRSACRPMTRQGGRPLARAVRT